MDVDEHHRSATDDQRAATDASRKSRIKKRIATELMLESFEVDEEEGEQLDEEEQQLHLIIALLEDKVFELTGNPRLITYYRDLCCLR